MTTKRPRKIFVNLPVHDLSRSVAFWKKLGFEFDARFTDDKATCMLVGEDSYVMLLVKERFTDFTKKPISDATERTEVITALTAENRAEVDQLFETAIASGAREAMPTQDMGFMYTRSFYDLDGHHWELFFMDMSAIPQE